MGLLARHRRWWIAIALAVLSLPMLMQALTPREMLSARENRRLAPPPAWPQTLAQWSALPKATEAFITDHFGLRESLVRANAVLRYTLVSPTDLRVLYGRDRALFFNGDGMLEQSLGLMQRHADIARFADFAAALHAKYRAAGVGFLVAIAPNSTSVVRDTVPVWFKPQPPTEYDMMLSALAARGVPVADLRAVMVAAAERHPLFRRADTHWNRLGALVAYNALVARLDKPDWRIDPQRVFRGFTQTKGGDLARMLGAPDDIADEDAQIDLSSYGPPKLSERKLDTGRETGGNVTDSDSSGPRVVLVGDSFTEHAWRDYFGLHVSRLVWVHHEMCDFVPQVVTAQAPDIVILAPTERFMFCWSLKTKADESATAR
jgi:alginate O-acetyltransferase complex protein AlgJ